MKNNRCPSCQRKFEKNITRQNCPSCQAVLCSLCLYQRIVVPKLNNQMHQVCLKCYERITTELVMSKPPKGFLERIEKQTHAHAVTASVDPEMKALEQRLKALRSNAPSSSAAASLSNFDDPTSDDIVRQMNEELAIEQSIDQSLADRIRILRETLPAATPNTVVLPPPKVQKEEENDDEPDEFPWCTVCNENANRRCLDCDELFCEPCSKKIHRQSSYKKHQIEEYRPSAKIKKKYGY